MKFSAKEIDPIAFLALVLSILTSIVTLIKLFLPPSTSAHHDDWVILNRYDSHGIESVMPFMEFTVINSNIAGNTDVLSDIYANIEIGKCVIPFKWSAEVSIEPDTRVDLVYRRIHDALPTTLSNNVVYSREISFRPILMSASQKSACEETKNYISFGSFVLLAERNPITIKIQTNLHRQGSMKQFCIFKYPPGWRSNYLYLSKAPNRWFRFSCEWQDYEGAIYTGVRSPKERPIGQSNNLHYP